jgi:ATP-binding cassette subfamily B protein
MLKSLDLFAGHLRGKKALLTVLFLLGLAGSATSLVSPLIGKAFVDAVVERGGYGLVPYLAGAILALACGDLVLGTVRRLVHAKLSADVLVGIRRRLFAHCLHAPLVHIEGFRHGDLLSRFGSDIPKIQGLLVDSILGCIQNLLFLLVAAGILLNLSLPLALWSFLGLFIALGITLAFRGPVESGTRGIREVMADLSHFLAERLGALRAVRLHAAQTEDEGRFNQLNAHLVSRMLRFQALDSFASGLPGLVLTVSLAWIYFLGGTLLESGEIGLGTFVAFVLYQGRLFGPAQGLLGLVRNFQEAQVSFERVAEVLKGEATQLPELPKKAFWGNDLVFARVSFAYPGKAPVLQDLDLRVVSGERIALFGASGVGKSTLVQILFGLRKPSKGRVSLGEVSLGPGSVHLAEGLLGYAGCDPFLLHATVAENLRYGNPDVTSEALYEAARLADADSFIRALPDGYRTVIGGRGLCLSDGQRQRLGLARLFLQQPAVLVLDEAFSSLDPDTEARVRKKLWENFPVQTILVITHRLGGLEQFDRLLLLLDGRLRQVTDEELHMALAGESSRPEEVAAKGRRGFSLAIVR